MGRCGLAQLVDDLGRVPAPVDDPRAGRQRHRLGDAGQHVRQRQELIERVAVVEAQLLARTCHASTGSSRG